MTTTTENMALVLATVEETLGPEWAELINAAFELLDNHDHSDGKGVQITPSGLNINDDLDVQGQSLENVLNVILSTHAAADTAKTGSLQRVGNNLYYVNSSGVAVQITSGSSVNSAGSGQITIDEPASFPHSVTTGDANKVLLVPTNSVANTLTLPAATNAMLFHIKDKSGSAQTNNITVTPNGTDTIDGVNSDFTINENKATFGFISDGVSAWYVI